MAAVRVGIRKDTELQELATTPLWLSILTLAYQDKSVEDLLAARSPAIQRQQVLKTYVQHMLQRRGSETLYSPQQTMHWLAWLAEQLTQHSQTEFYIERMQPDWLQEHRLYQLYRSRFARFVLSLIIGLLVLLLSVLMLIHFIGLSFALFLGLVQMLLIGGSVWYYVELDAQIEPAEAIVWSWESAQESLKDDLTLGLFFGLVFGLSVKPVVGLITGIIVGPAIGLIVSFIDGWKGKTLDERNFSKPNQGIWHSARNCLLIGLMGGFVFGTVVGLVLGLTSLEEGLVFGLFSVVFIGLLFGLVAGGIACISHITMRFFLWRAGYAPLNYPRFLDYAADRILLRKVGGYIFIHRLLLEYFASLETETKSDDRAKQP